MTLIIEEIDNNIIMSNDSGHAGHINAAEREQLSPYLNGVEGLLMEGDKQSMFKYRRANPYCVEVLCWEGMKGKNRRFIVEEQRPGAIDRSGLLEKYGVPLSTTEHLLAGYVFAHGPPPINTEMAQHSLLAQLEQHKSRSFSAIEPTRATEVLFNSLSFFLEKNLIQTFTGATEAFIEYLGILREEEYWKPEVREFRELHQGRLAFCIGAYHIPFVTAVLSDAPKRDIPTITEYFAKKNPALVQFLENE